MIYLNTCKTFDGITSETKALSIIPSLADFYVSN